MNNAQGATYRQLLTLLRVLSFASISFQDNININMSDIIIYYEIRKKITTLS